MLIMLILPIKEMRHREVVCMEYIFTGLSHSNNCEH